MDYLQYAKQFNIKSAHAMRFKPYYKWITFNIMVMNNKTNHIFIGFKPYYKWITFNILGVSLAFLTLIVLNLIINGLPSILLFKTTIIYYNKCFKPYYKWITFNITIIVNDGTYKMSFKPYYKWITFNIRIE